MAAELVLGRRKVAARTEDVSFAGVLLRSDARPPPRALVRVELRVPPDGAALALHGMVARVLPAGDPSGLGPAVGVQWYALGAQEQARWNEFIQHVRRTYPHAARRPVFATPEDAWAPDPVRRAHERYPAVLKVEVPTVHELLTMYTRDVSRGGMFLAVADPPPLGTRLLVEIIHPRTGAPFPVTCVVRRRVLEAELAGVGVELVGLDEARRQEFWDFVQDQIELVDVALDEDAGAEAQASAPAEVASRPR